MSFDEEPLNEHRECQREIHLLEAENERPRNTNQQLRNAIEKLVEWPDELPMLSEEDLALLKAAEATGGDDGPSA